MSVGHLHSEEISFRPQDIRRTVSLRNSNETPAAVHCGTAALCLLETGLLEMCHSVHKYREQYKAFLHFVQPCIPTVRLTSTVNISHKYRRGSKDVPYNYLYYVMQYIVSEDRVF